MVHFREVQQFRQPWLWAIILVSFGVMSWSALREMPGSHPARFVPLLFGALAVGWIYACRLVTEVRDDHIEVAFRLLWPARRIPLADVREAKAAHYHPILDYGGWGVRWSLRKGRAYNVSGDRGVLLELANGSKVMIGSQQPEALERAIAERRALPNR